MALAMVSVLCTIVSCSKWDEFKQHTANGETLYTGKLDSVKVYSGRLRIRITGLLPADPKIEKLKITWNGNKDSVIFPVTKSGVIEAFDKTFPSDEGMKNFRIQTFDGAGNGSVVVQASGMVYGPRFESGLVNRPVGSAELQNNGSALIAWDAFDTSAGAKGTFIDYTTSSNTTASVFAPVGQATTTLANYKQGTAFRFRTLYLPSASVIDSFYTAFEERNVAYNENVTDAYLSNTGTPFNNIPSPDWRFATLAAPWRTNAAGLNKGGGTFGGWSAEPWQGTTGFIGWETWGNTPITDGTIYQATSAALPAGKYTIEYSYYSEIQQNSTVYCLVAAGGNGLPVLANLSTALASSALYNGAVVGTTGPSRNETKSFSFTLAAPQVVSIGFLGNLTVNNYFIVRHIKLFRNH